MKSPIRLWLRVFLMDGAVHTLLSGDLQKPLAQLPGSLAPIPDTSLVLATCSVQHKKHIWDLWVSSTCTPR